MVRTERWLAQRWASPALESAPGGLTSWRLPWLAVWPWANHITYMSLSFLFCKMGKIIKPHLCVVVWELKEIRHVKGLAPSPACGQGSGDAKVVIIPKTTQSQEPLCVSQTPLSTWWKCHNWWIYPQQSISLQIGSWWEHQVVRKDWLTLNTVVRAGNRRCYDTRSAGLGTLSSPEAGILVTPGPRAGTG